MTIFIHLKPDMDTLTYEGVDFWNECDLGGRPFIYLCDKNKTLRAFIDTQDIIRMTIEEAKNDT